MRLVVHAWKFTSPRGRTFIYAQIGQEPNSYTMTVGPGGNRAAEAFLKAFQRDELLTEEDADRARLKAEGGVSKPRRSKGDGTFEFYSTCDAWPIGVEVLTRMIRRGKQITRKAFLEHVNAEQMKDIEGQLGYAQHPRDGIVMAADGAVEYYRSEVKGCPAVYFLWSGIEHVFLEPSCLPAKH